MIGLLRRVWEKICGPGAGSRGSSWLVLSFWGRTHRIQVRRIEAPCWQLAASIAVLTHLPDDHQDLHGMMVGRLSVRRPIPEPSKN